MQENRLFKYKFTYFFSISFILGWVIFFGYNIFNIYIQGYGLQKKYFIYRVPIFILYFSIFPLLNITLVYIFRECRKFFLYLNISTVLIIIFNLIFFYVGVQTSTNNFVYSISFMFMNLLFVIGPVLFINYFRQKNISNEIDKIGISE